MRWQRVVIAALSETSHMQLESEAGSLRVAPPIGSGSSHLGHEYVLLGHSQTSLSDFYIQSHHIEATATATAQSSAIVTTGAITSDAKHQPATRRACTIEDDRLLVSHPPPVGRERLSALGSQLWAKAPPFKEKDFVN